MTRLARSVVWGAVVLAAAALVLGPGPAGAEPVDESGYWWRLQAVAGAPLAPPGVGDGQLYVAADAAGTAAVSAVRVAVGDAVVEALVLTETESSGVPDLRACPTSGWEAPDGAGAYADRPTDERCASEAIAGVRSDDGTWSFPVGALVTGGVLDVVLVPGAGGQSVTFDAPGSSAIVLAPPARPAPSAPAPPRPTADAITAPPVAAAPPTFAAPPLAVPGGSPASSFERDVDAFPAPPSPVASTPSPGDDGGSRAPLAILAVAIPVAAWAYRTRTALAAASTHVLARPLRIRRDALASAGAVIATDADELRGGGA